MYTVGLLILIGFILIGFVMMWVVSRRNTITPRGIVIHHAAVTTTHDGRAVDAGVLALDHRRRGFRIFYRGRTYHLGYHYFICPDGTVQRGRPERCRGAHAVGHNTSIGICLAGDFSTEHNPRGERGLTAPTEAQMQSLLRLCRSLCRRHEISFQDVRRHADVCGGTLCPGDRFPFERFVHELEAAAAGP
jgi:hypothetical protein